jgi:hypothetical protein
MLNTKNYNLIFVVFFSIVYFIFFNITPILSINTIIIYILNSVLSLVLGYFVIRALSEPQFSLKTWLTPLIYSITFAIWIPIGNMTKLVSEKVSQINLTANSPLKSISELNKNIDWTIFFIIFFLFFNLPLILTLYREKKLLNLFWWLIPIVVFFICSYFITNVSNSILTNILH